MRGIYKRIIQSFLISIIKIAHTFDHFIFSENEKPIISAT